jgi:hypothetical protein
VVYAEAVEVIDPHQELTGQALRDVIEHCIEWGRTILSEHAGERMEERLVSGGQILAALRGILCTDQCVAGKWRYLGRRNDVQVCFTFDVDEEGNLLLVVTVMKDGTP